MWHSSVRSLRTRSWRAPRAASNWAMTLTCSTGRSSPKPFGQEWSPRSLGDGWMLLNYLTCLEIGLIVRASCSSLLEELCVTSNVAYCDMMLSYFQTIVFLRRLLWFRIGLLPDCDEFTSWASSKCVCWDWPTDSRDAIVPVCNCKTSLRWACNLLGPVHMGSQLPNHARTHQRFHMVPIGWSHQSLMAPS